MKFNLKSIILVGLLIFYSVIIISSVSSNVNIRSEGMESLDEDETETKEKPSKKVSKEVVENVEESEQDE